MLDDFQVQNYHSKRTIDVTFSPYAEFGTDHRRGARHQRDHRHGGLFDSVARFCIPKGIIREIW